MNTYRFLVRLVVSALVAASLHAPAFAQGPADLRELAAEAAQRSTQGDRLQLAQAVSCAAIGQRIAAREGGQLGRADASTRDGQTVCVIVVIIPPKNGQHGRRQEFVVPAS